MAHTPEGTPEQILYRTGYTVSYNSHWKQPNWVSYELLRDDCKVVLHATTDLPPTTM